MAHPGSALKRLGESQEATDEGVALLALEARLVRPRAIGDRLVIEEVLRLLVVRQGLPLRRLRRLLWLRSRRLCLHGRHLAAVCLPDLDIVAAGRLLAGF